MVLTLLRKVVLRRFPVLQAEGPAVSFPSPPRTLLPGDFPLESH